MKQKKRPAFDFDPCISCSVCVQACPVSCIELSVNGVDALRNLYPQVDARRCLGCNICTNSCPVGAISLVEAA